MPKEKVGVITDAFPWDQVLAGPVDVERVWSPKNEFPPRELLRDLDVMIVVGPLADDDAASQLAGAVKLARQDSKKVLVFAYRMHVGQADAAFLGRLGHPLPNGNVPGPVFGFPPEFRDFFTEYGLSGASFFDLDVQHARAIGWIHQNEGPEAATALCWELERGVTYVVPYHLSSAASPAQMLEALVSGVNAHRKVLAVGLPEYLSEVRLGAAEDGVLADVDRLKETLRERSAEAKDLERWRHLIGRASGSSLVALVVDALNVVLDGSGYRAEQRPETGAEDLWLVDTDGGDFALGEAKGIGGGISRANVSQVDSHREANGLPPEFPGMLIVNAFRNDDHLDRKQGEDVAPNVVSLARGQNVVVLRTWDVYQLVGRKFDGKDAAELLLKAVGDPEGGWLRIDTTGAEFRKA